MAHLLADRTASVTPGTAVQLLNQRDKVRWIQIKPFGTNNAKTYFGVLSTLTATDNSYEMMPYDPRGEKFDFSPGSIEISKFYMDADLAAEGFSWIALITTSKG
jgi:hypothetical protein